ncbi:MAG: AtpZ/AtpI family protein [Thermoleophilia bacterium]
MPHEEPREKGSRRREQRKSPAQAESIAFMLLAGIAVGLGVGYVIDRLAKTSPLFLIVGVFVGFAAALYAVFLETR